MDGDRRPSTRDEISTEPAAIWVLGRELAGGEIRWGHRGAAVEDVWLTGESAGLAHDLWSGQDVAATVRKDGVALYVRQARVVGARDASLRLRLWLSADDKRHVVAQWWRPPESDPLAKSPGAALELEQGRVRPARP